MAKILRHIDFSRPVKIEVGSGGFPQTGYLHVDIDPAMPDLDAVCEMGKEALPFPDGCAEEILSNHSIEHVSWLDAAKVVSDWARVLKVGGRLFLRTPDLDFICRMYIERKTTKEHPVDESNMVSVFGDYGSAHWANIKLFAGQNYKGNFHNFCLDMDMLTDLLKRNGFGRISRLTGEIVFSPGEICAEAFKI
jgi:predicted SAM-dependent methyltransferase